MKAYAPHRSAEVGQALPVGSYEARRDWIGEHFEGRAEGWARMTAGAPVGRIRRTVQEGRGRMRHTLLSFLPEDLRGRRVLDAGCGPGETAIALARRGARVVGVDLSPSFVALARERVARAGLADRVELREGDMLGIDGPFDHVIAMDSLIHYPGAERLAAIERLTATARRSFLFTFAPRTPLLSAMHAVGRLFPKARRAPAIRPASAPELREALGARLSGEGWGIGRERRIRSGFYISQALELSRREAG